MSKSLKLHPEHGLNPMVCQCHICGRDIGIALFGYNKAQKAPKSGVIPGDTCNKCDLYRTIGVILIETRDGESGDNPYRTGRQFILKKEGFERIFKGPEARASLDYGVAYIEEKVIKATGIDRMQPSAET